MFNTSNKDFSFKDVIAYIDQHYDFTPSSFKNGELYNEENQNNGSCKVFGYAKLHNLSKEDTLNLFTEYYNDVLKTPEGEDHQNIRNFMKFGWEGILFSNDPLSQK